MNESLDEDEKYMSYRLTPGYIKELNVFVISIPEVSSIKRHAIRVKQIIVKQIISCRRLDEFKPRA